MGVRLKVIGIQLDNLETPYPCATGMHIVNVRLGSFASTYRWAIHTKTIFCKVSPEPSSSPSSSSRPRPALQKKKQLKTVLQIVARATTRKQVCSKTHILCIEIRHILLLSSPRTMLVAHSQTPIASSGSLICVKASGMCACQFVRVVTQKLFSISCRIQPDLLAEVVVPDHVVLSAVLHGSFRIVSPMLSYDSCLFVSCLTEQ